jgi:hypothetical protein
VNTWESNAVTLKHVSATFSSSGNAARIVALSDSVVALSIFGHRSKALSLKNGGKFIHTGIYCISS